MSSGWRQNGVTRGNMWFYSWGNGIILEEFIVSFRMKFDSGFENGNRDAYNTKFIEII